MTRPAVRVRVARRFTQRPERVFDAWLDPAKAGRWLFATPTGTMVAVEIDARLGGRFRFVDRRDGVDVAHDGEYLAIERPRRLMFRFWVGGDATAATQVTVDIAPAGTGCDCTITHEEVWAEFEGRVGGGWTMILQGLAAMLER